MNSTYPFLLILVCFFLQIENSFAQPANDDCEGAIELLDVMDWCSSTGAYDNSTATASTYDAPMCFTDDDNDMWFRFTAIATDLTVTVIGATSPVLGGTMWQPQVALYTVPSCGGTINSLGCAADVAGNNIVQLYEGGVIIGQEYYIRIDAGGTLGSFQLCINSYFQPPIPGSDCPVSTTLCDNSPFTVQQVSGAGADPNEASGSCLDGGLSTSESNSTWYTWTCDQSGTLEFTLTPTNPGDDLDFVVYELPNGVEDCTGKELLRCMASGGGNIPGPCMGSTGLFSGQTDVVEPSNCDLPTQNNFLAPLDMVSGTSYALLVNNFTNTGNGFDIEFGGSGTFLGPQADFTTSDPDLEICYGESITFNDNSTFALGALVGWEWSFGVDAQPATASGIGPHNVTWTTPGLKTVVLTVESDLGCIVVEVQTILVSPCCDNENAMTVLPSVADVDCPNSQDGSISLTVNSNAAPHTFLWENGSANTGISNLGMGDYLVTITNDATCDTVLTYTVGGPPEFILTPQITMPTCNGGQDGAIELLTFGGTAPYTYSWNSAPFTANNTLANIPIGTYNVIVEDINGCQTTMDIEVNELELLLDPNIDAVTQPSCNGLSDGALQMIVINGLPPYQFDFNDGNGFQSSNTLNNIPAGNYTVNVIDANLCQGNYDIVVPEPDPLVINLDVTNVSCFGEADGTIVANVSGGVGNYSYSWSNGGSNNNTITPLDVGTYTVTVMDGNNCEIIASEVVTQPAELFIDVAEVIDVICFGDQTGTIVVMGAGGNPPFQYSIDGIIFQDLNSFTDLTAGDYTITILDQLGCTDDVIATVSQPLELIVDAGPDLFIDLGFSDDIISTVTPAFSSVTYAWTPIDSLSCIDCPRPEANPTNTKTYTVTVTDEMGCTATDEVTVYVNKARPIYIPNAFSPNFDGFNDYFTAYGGPAARRINELVIFNRWGAVVYEANNIPLGEPTLGWNGTFKGKEFSPDVFAFYMIIEFIDDEKITYEGDVTIVK